MTRQDVGHYPDVTGIIERIEHWFGVSSRVGADHQRPRRRHSDGHPVRRSARRWRRGRRIRARNGTRSSSSPRSRSTRCARRRWARASSGFRRNPSSSFPLDRVLRVDHAGDTRHLPDGSEQPDRPRHSCRRRGTHRAARRRRRSCWWTRRTPISAAARSSAPLLERHRNVVIGRTFAKGHGIAGLRVGALVAHPSTLGRLRAMQLPFSVNYCAMAALDAALDDRGYLDVVRRRGAASHASWSTTSAGGTALTFWPSEANFVLFRVGPDAGAIAEALQARAAFWFATSRPRPDAQAASASPRASSNTPHWRWPPWRRSLRRARVDRRTTETQIQLAIDLDGRGRYTVAHGRSLSRPHARALRPTRRIRPHDCGHGRSRRGRAPHRRGCRHRARRGGRPRRSATNAASIAPGIS